MQELRAYLRQIGPLPKAVEDDFLKQWEEVSFGRKEMMTKAGEVARTLYFVTEGVQRSYYLKDGKEHTIAFTYPYQFSGIPESFITQTPSLYFLETIGPSQMLAMPYEQVKLLLNKHRELERWFLKAVGNVLGGVIYRHYELMAFSIEERFRAFVERSPHMLNMVPHKYLASYLGIDPTNFSKLLGRIKI